MDKNRLLSLVIRRMSDDLSVVAAAAQAAHDAAIDTENIPDNEYDTLSLEASYLAQGQANRAQEIRAALDAYRALSLRPFAPEEPIRLTALVTLEDGEGGSKTVFIGPDGGGLKICEEGETVVVITPGSPIGRELLGKRAGEAVLMESGVEFDIVAVS
jgi:transcription elongation GreA/GreB family factor